MPRANEQVLQTLPQTEDPVISATYKYRKRGNHDVLAYSLVEGTLPSTGTGGGSVSGTYKLQAASPDSLDWVDVADGTFTDTAASGTFVPGGDMDIRWYGASGTTAVVVRIG